MPKPDPVPELKRYAAAELCRALDGCSLNDAATGVRIDRWRIADIRAGRLGRFSLETLIRFLNRINSEVSLEIHHSPLMVGRDERG